MGNKKENSADPKSETKTSLESLENKELSEEMRQILDDYMLSPHGISDDPFCDCARLDLSDVSSHLMF